MGKRVVCYIIDNIEMILSCTEAKPLQHLGLVMDASRRHELYLKLKRCFCALLIGHII